MLIVLFIVPSMYCFYFLFPTTVHVSHVHEGFYNTLKLESSSVAFQNPPYFERTCCNPYKFYSRICHTISYITSNTHSHFRAFKMCTSHFYRHSCGCTGEFISRDKCDFYRAWKRLIDRGVPHTDASVWTTALSCAGASTQVHHARPSR